MRALIGPGTFEILDYGPAKAQQERLAELVTEAADGAANTLACVLEEDCRLGLRSRIRQIDPGPLVGGSR